MKIRIDEDYYCWHCEWCDTENRVLWIRVHEGLSCGACHRKTLLGGETACLPGTENLRRAVLNGSCGPEKTGRPGLHDRRRPFSSVKRQSATKVTENRMESLQKQSVLIHLRAVSGCSRSR